jgi:hypothetical protein
MNNTKTRKIYISKKKKNGFKNKKWWVVLKYLSMMETGQFVIRVQLLATNAGL